MIDTCACGGEIFKSKTLSRCLRCRKSTVWEVDAKIYYKDKNKYRESDGDEFVQSNDFKV